MDKIKNSASLGKNRLRKDALDILESGLQAIDTKKIISEAVKTDEDRLYIKGHSFSLKEINRIFVVGVGKCSLSAAEALEDIFGDAIAEGVAMDVRAGKLKKIQARQGTHPFSSEENIHITREIVELLASAREDDLVIFIISGGGSSLLCQPRNFTCRQESAVVECLINSGADIYEVNTVRKHLSLARGGHLAKYAHPARAISLVFSDVPGDDIEFVASGPTVKDTTTVQDAREVLEKYEADKKCGFNAQDLIETPKEDKYFAGVENIVLASNKKALRAMQNCAEHKGYRAELRSADAVGEAREVGAYLAEEINLSKPKTTIIYGGETTVKVKGDGRGGRNRELVLSALRKIKKGGLMSSLATDGADNNEAAGALADDLTREKARRAGLNPEKFLEENNSGEFFAITEDEIITGYTGSNVADLILGIKE